MNNFICPKCLGRDYFMGIRTISGVTVTRWNGLKTKQLPICRVCDEIMVAQHGNANLINKIGRIGLYTFLGFIIIGVMAAFISSI